MSLPAIRKSRSLEEILNQFLDNFISKNTREAYIGDIQNFSNFMSEKFPEISAPDQILPTHIIHFREKLRNDYSPGTVNRRLSALSSVFRELQDHQLIDKNPLAGLKRPPNQTIRPTLGFSDLEVRTILDSFNEEKLIELQYKTIFAFLFFTGARVSEMIRVRVRDIEKIGDIDVVRLLGKGSKYRTLPINIELKRLLLSLIGFRGKSDSDYIFTNSRNSSSEMLSRMTIHNIVKKTLAKLTLDSNRSCHSSRRTLISNLLENGSRLEEVQKIAGHSSPITTIRYNVRDTDMDQSPLLRVNFDKKLKP